MPATDALKQVMPYAGRIIESDYAQDNLRDAADNLRAAYRRAQGRKAAQAADDKELYAHVRRAVSSAKAAGTAIVTGKEKPARRWPKLLLVAALAAAGAAVASRKSGAAPAEPGATTTPTT